MTIIVYHNGTLATDSMFMNVAELSATPIRFANKLFVSKNKRFAYALGGKVLDKKIRAQFDTDLNTAIDELQKDNKTGNFALELCLRKIGRYGILVLHDRVIKFNTDKDGSDEATMITYNIGETLVCGSTEYLAYAIIDNTTTATEAVKFCIDNNSTCGGQIRHFNIKELVKG